MPRPMKSIDVKYMALNMYNEMVAVHGFENTWAIYKVIKKKLKTERKRRKALKKKKI